MGIRGEFSKSTVADAKENRAWRIYRDFGRVLIEETRRLYANEDFDLQLQETIYALDATIIDLCLPVFSWGALPHNKSGDQAVSSPGPAGNIPR